MSYEYDVCVVGGLGHVGLPLSIALAGKGLRVCAFDINKKTYDIVSSGKMPFNEQGAPELLKSTLASGKFTVSLDPESITKAENVVITVGTPVDTNFGPQLNVLESFIAKHSQYFRDGQLIILRSTVYPGTTQKMYHFITENNIKVDLAYCPERIAQGKGLKELYELPQIVSSPTKRGEERAAKLFSRLTSEVLIGTPLEAELAKLYSNALRYTNFALANQFLMIANDAGADYYNVHKLLTHNYPRAANISTPGFAAGPCLYKDAVQLNAFHSHNFHIGNSAILINQSMPFYIFRKVKEQYPLREKTVGILGMTFKADIDDPRDSLSFKLRELFEYEAKKLYCTDAYYKEEGFLEAQELIDKSDIVIVATPHKEYENLKIGKDKIVVDVWNFYKNGGKI